MKKYKVILAILVILCIVSSFVSCTKSIDSNISATNAYSKWMSNVNDTTLIKDIVIPGSHDSGTYGMPAMFATQDLTILDQLNSGFRYFDIRVTSKMKIFHSFYSGTAFIPILKDIVNFIKSNPSEFLILDFQHFKGDSQLALQDAFVEYGLSHYTLINNSNKSDLDWIDALTLKEVRGKVLICWGSDTGIDNELVYRRNNDECTLNDCILDSYYYSDQNKKASSDYIKEGLPFYYEKYSNKNKGLWVLQGQLTKAGANLKKLEDSHSKNMNDYISSLSSNKALLNKTNIIMRDFVNKEKAATIIKLNIDKGTANNFPNLV